MSMHINLWVYTQSWKKFMSWEKVLKEEINGKKAINSIWHESWGRTAGIKKKPIWKEWSVREDSWGGNKDQQEKCINTSEWSHWSPCSLKLGKYFMFKE